MKSERIALLLSVLAFLVALVALGMAMTPFYLEGELNLTCSQHSPKGKFECVVTGFKVGKLLTIATE